ncbi:cell division control protein 24 [[Candida] jaroonii]|uniref:Cell division control protein 24 n=1 Tax=[Candida] jaroonii TaxID=467808 RepID=A0ACA9Y5C9_9ASCO|nr:cell division control protein 24 [[Candida] jaroonii]
MEPVPPIRSFSSQSHSNSSISLSSKNVTRVSSTPIGISSTFNQGSNAKDHLFYQCSILLMKLSKIDGMEPFLRVAHNLAERCSEQQALSLSQQDNLSTINDQRSSLNSNGFQMIPDNSSVNSFNPSNSTSIMTNGPNSASSSTSNANLNIYTFTSGILPTKLGVDPVTKLWKLFQQGAPLCILFNLINKEHEITFIGSDDVKMCKRLVYDFLIAVKTHLNLDDDIMFTISNVFSDTTNDLLKIIKVVDTLLPENLKNFQDNSIGDIIINNESSKVFKEIIETERKYVKDLEILASYKQELAITELISSEQIHTLFPNLNEIIDFQRRFLNGLECNINIPNDLTRIGSVFIHAANGPFKSYEPWTLGQLNAIDLINKESSNLARSSKILDPGLELQSFILKPIQRLCKYPLLLKELIKSWPTEDSSSYNELILAQQAMKEVANQVNEAQRRSENIGFIQSLVDRVQDWKGYNLKDLGDLMYHENVLITGKNSEKEYLLCLFEKVLLVFVEHLNKDESSGKKRRDLLSSRKKSTSSVTSSTVNLLENLNQAKEKSTLVLSGRVYIQEITNILKPDNQDHSIIIQWVGKSEEGTFHLKYKTEESRDRWEKGLRYLKSAQMARDIQNKFRSSSSHDDFYDKSSIRSSNGSSYHRHHSSSSTYSMMGQQRIKSMGEPSRVSSSSFTNPNSGHETSFSSVSSQSQNNSQGYLNHNQISIKIIYGRIIINSLLTVPANVQFGELYSKISNKIASSEEVNDDIVVNKLRYKDEDGDFVVMDSHDDWVLALDTFQETNDKHLTIWVS